MYTNCDQLSNKFDELHTVICSDSPDIILLVETIPKAQKTPIGLPSLSICNYTLFTNFDPDIRCCGKRGICVYVANYLCPSEIVFEQTTIEHLWFKLKLSSEYLTIGTIYCSPSVNISDRTTELCDLVSKVCRDTKPTYLLIMGDFNYPGIQWNSDPILVSNSYEQSFVDTIHHEALSQLVSQPTRFRIGSEPHLLDLLLTNEVNMVENIEYCSSLGKSDHVCVKLLVNCFPANQDGTQSFTYNYNKGDYDKARYMINELNWDNLFANNNAEGAWVIFKDHLNRIIEESIPKFSGIKKRKHPYITSKVIKLKAQKDLLWKKYSATRHFMDYARFTRMRNSIRNLTRQLRLEYEASIAKSIRNNPKRFWNYVKSKTKVKPPLPNLKSCDGTEACTDIDKATVLNSFFTSVFTRENVDDIPGIDQYGFSEPLSDISISSDQIYEQLKLLKPSKSAGPDGMHPIFLKETAAEICKPLCSIFRKSLDEGLLPGDWKVGNVKPVFKKGDRHSPENYRPISLTSVICKVFESIIRKNIINHMTTNSLFAKEQHGFQSGRSCMTQLMVATEYWTNILQQGDSVDIIYLDFKKAFDSVAHKRLLIKLKAYGIDGLLLNWITDFLTGRKQRVVINNTYSSWSDVISGIPQGSVLGPILFSIYINDLPSSLSNSTLLFADDTKIYCRIPRINNSVNIESLQQDIDRLVTWSAKWQLPFNLSKCTVLHLGKFNPRHVYNMNGHSIEEVSKEKDLGVMIDEQLKFHDQTSYVTSKANRTIGIIKKTFMNINTDTFLNLYKALIRPQLEYANVIWGPFYSVDQNKVENVQRAATRMIPSIRHLSYEQRLRILNLPSLKHRRLRGDMINVYRLLHNMFNLDQAQFFTIDASSRTRGHSFKLYKQQLFKDVRANVFSQRVINNWNKLPTEVVTSSNLSLFKTRCDAFYQEVQYDT